MNTHNYDWYAERLRREQHGYFGVAEVLHGLLLGAIGAAAIMLTKESYLEWLLFSAGAVLVTDGTYRMAFGRGILGSAFNL